MGNRGLLLKLAMTLTAALLLAVGISLARRWQTTPENPRLAALLETADTLRAAAEQCAAGLAAEEARFRAFDRQVDSLRAAVRAHESGAGRRTVEAGDYEEYLELFDRYNAAVPEWHAQADSLRGRWEACRAKAEEHNEVLEAAAALRYGTAPPD